MRRAALALILLGAATTAVAADRDGDGVFTEHDLPDEVRAIEGDPDYGAYLASECVTCHRVDGRADGIPSITGWAEPSFAAALHAYRNGMRTHPVMGMIAKRLSDEEIAALAAYFATLD